jgi:hypothetical protein
LRTQENAVTAKGHAMKKGIAWAVCGVAVLASAAGAQPSYDFDFATVGAVNNAAFTATNPLNPLVVGRGSVAYECRISKLETTTAQWLEFMNTFANVARNERTA